MSIEQTIAENTLALREFTIAITNLTEYLAGQSAQPEVANNTGSRRRRKASAALSPSDVSCASESVAESTVLETAPAETVAAVEPVAENVTEEKPAEPEHSLPQVTYKQASDAVVNVANVKGRATALAILEKFGIAKLPEASPDQYVAIIAACEEALA